MSRELKIITHNIWKIVKSFYAINVKDYQINLNCIFIYLLYVIDSSNKTYAPCNACNIFSKCKLERTAASDGWQTKKGKSRFQSRDASFYGVYLKLRRKLSGVPFYEPQRAKPSERMQT